MISKPRYFNDLLELQKVLDEEIGLSLIHI